MNNVYLLLLLLSDEPQTILSPRSITFTLHQKGGKRCFLAIAKHILSEPEIFYNYSRNRTACPKFGHRGKTSEFQNYALNICRCCRHTQKIKSSFEIIFDFEMSELWTGCPNLGHNARPIGNSIGWSTLQWPLPYCKHTDERTVRDWCHKLKCCGFTIGTSKIFCSFISKKGKTRMT